MLIGVRGRGRRAAGARREELGELLRVRARPEPTGALIGLEHEFRVLAGGEPVDFRELIHTLPIDGQRLDPGDTNAHRCRSGISITADGDEAEFATPPIAVRPGFPAELAAWAERGRAEIQRALPPGYELEGFSTHISVTMDDAINERVCALFAETFAAGFALLIEGPQSQGIYIRPRPGRIELCGEFAAGATLEAAAVFGVGAVLACAAAATSGEVASLPPRLKVVTLPGVERYGIRVRRDAYGVDLYAAGREALLTTTEGPSITAQAQIEAAWRHARAAVRDRVTRAELRGVDAIIGGRRNLAIEGCDEGHDGSNEDRAPLFGRCGSATSAFGRAVSRVERPDFTVTPRLLTWDLAVLRLDGVREAYAAIPRSALAEFEERLARGKLDRQLRLFLEREDTGRTLESRAQVAAPALFDTLTDPAALVAPERDPEGAFGALQSVARAGKQVAATVPARPGKVAARRWKVIPLPLPREPQTLGHEPSSGGAGPPAPVQVSPVPPVGTPRSWVAAAVVGTIGVLALAGALATFAVVHGSDSGGGGDVSTPTHETGGVAPAATSGSATEVAKPTSTPLSAGVPTDTTLAPPPSIAGAAATAPPSPSAASSETAVPSPAVTKPAGDATAVVTSTATATPTATARPTETPRPTATFTPTSTPTATPTPTIIIIALPPPPIPTAVPTAVPPPACTPSATKNCP